MDIDVTKGVEEKAGSFIQYDEDDIFYEVEKRYRGKIEILPMDRAIEKYRFVRENMGKLIRMDRYAKKAFEERTGGYFLRIRKNRVVDEPILTCMILRREIEQKPWNMVVVEEGSKAMVYTGCSAAAFLGRAWHIGATEFFIGRNARLDYVMIHVWPKTLEVRPRSSALVEENGVFNSMYVVLKPGARIQANPVVRAKDKARVELVNIMKGESSILRIGGEIHLEGVDSRGLIKSRSVAYENAKIIARSKLVGYKRCRGHVDCRGIVMKGEIEAIPVIESRSGEALLTHEASIGRIEEDQLFYLETRGFCREEAMEMIVKGFLNPEIPWLDRKMKKEIEILAEAAARGA